MTKAPIYLDYAAATPVDEAVMRAMEPYFGRLFFNPSATYLSAKAVAADLRAARESVARVLGAKPSEIVFTAGGTEANNLAIAGVMSQYPKGNIVISVAEHESVREPSKQYDSREVVVGADGVMNLAALEKAIDDQTVLVSVLYANNEIGTIQPLRDIATLLQKVKKQRLEQGNDRPLFFHSDACQAGNYLDLHVSRLGVDLMTLNGGKLYGPKQSGALYVKTGVILEPQIRGGGQERGLRSGTENVAGAAGFTVALIEAQHMRAAETKRLTGLRDDFIKKLISTFPDAQINGSLKQRLPNNVSVTFPGVDNERLMMQLDEAGIICAIGSACSASKEESSHVLRAISLADDEARATLRFTLGRQTTAAQLDETIRTLKELLHG